MAINIGSVSVITNARALANIADADGISGSFHATPQNISTIIDFTTPMMTSVMSSNVTFTEANATDAFKGTTSMLLLDTSATGYTPTFSANVKWPASTTPTWSSSRYWMISFQICNLGVIRANAQGYTTAAAAAAVEMVDAPWIGDVYASNNGAQAQLNFYMTNSGNAGMSNAGTSGSSGGTWIDPKVWLISGAASDYDVRYTYSGATGNVIENAGNGVWLNLGTTRAWSILDTSSGPGDHTIAGPLEIRNASTLAILASGVVQMTVNYEP